MISTLIVDDHPAICFAIKAVLDQKEKFSTHSVSDGVAALHYIKTHSPQLVLLDIALSKMDGLEVLSRIHQLDKQIKVIVMTGQPAEIYAERTMRTGAASFFSKDNDLTQLVELCELVMLDYHCFPSFCFERLNHTAFANEESQQTQLARLSDRELTVLRYLAEGMTNKEIADRLLLSNKTISTYKARLLDKLQLSNLEQLSPEYFSRILKAY